MENTTLPLTLTERQAIANAFLTEVKKDAQNQSFPEHWELGYLRATLDALICKFPEVAQHVK